VPALENPAHLPDLQPAEGKYPWVNRCAAEYYGLNSITVSEGPTAATEGLAVTSTAGPLVRSSANPRYFQDAHGRIVYLTGSHTWASFQDLGRTDPPPTFDYDQYLDFLVAHRHNFLRLWNGQLPVWVDSKGGRHYAMPHPWSRTGPGQALDGKPRYDLTRFDDAYFARLRTRVAAAGRRGIYVAVMLFEGGHVEAQAGAKGWFSHPFNARNNVNAIDGDPNGDDSGVEIVTLEAPGVTAVQQAYIRKVVDSLNDLDNVLYEIANEAGPRSAAWQHHMIDVLRRYQSTKPRQHPIGMTSPAWGTADDALTTSRADWISPAGASYKDNPPAADGRYVVVPDTDHLWGIGGSAAWVWKSFLRGLNPIFMDPYRETSQRDDAAWPAIRRAMGDTRAYALRLDLRAATPRGDLSSTGYCLAVPGREYLVFAPTDSGRGGRLAAMTRRTVTVDLSGEAGAFDVEWFDPRARTATPDARVNAGARRSLTAPFPGDAVLYLWRAGDTSHPTPSQSPPSR
jgi:hypothetical protein